MRNLENLREFSKFFLHFLRRERLTCLYWYILNVSNKLLLGCNDVIPNFRFRIAEKTGKKSKNCTIWVKRPNRLFTDAQLFSETGPEISLFHQVNTQDKRAKFPIQIWIESNFEIFGRRWINYLTLRRPLRRQLRLRWFFDVSKVKESSFLIGPHESWLRFLQWFSNLTSFWLKWPPVTSDPKSFPKNYLVFLVYLKHHLKISPLIFTNRVRER